MAVIGRSGSGKSTLVDIILGLIKPTKGDILINNCNLRENIVRSWQSKIGYVPQEIYLLDSSIYENIAFGIPLEKIDRERVRSVSKIAQISSFIENELEFKYEHIIGEREYSFQEVRDKELVLQERYIMILKLLFLMKQLAH